MTLRGEKKKAKLRRVHSHPPRFSACFVGGGVSLFMQMLPILARRAQQTTAPALVLKPRSDVATQRSSVQMDTCHLLCERISYSMLEAALKPLDSPSRMKTANIQFPVPICPPLKSVTSFSCICISVTVEFQRFSADLPVKCRMYRHTVACPL